MNAAAKAGALAAAFATVAPAPPQAQPPPPQPPTEAGQCRVGERVTRLGDTFSPNRVLRASISPATLTAPQFADFQTASMRLLLKVDAPGDRRWRLVLRDAQQRVLSVIAAEDFQRGTGQLEARWTGILPGNRVILELIEAGPDVRISVPRGVALPVASDENVFSLQGSTPAWTELHREGAVIDAAMQRSGQAVGMLHTSALDGTKRHSWCCTGVMVGPDLLLTNWHCGGAGNMRDEDYWEDACDNAVIDLGWDGGRIRRQFSCARVEAKSRELDFALLRVRGVLGDGSGGRGLPAVVSLRTPVAQERVYMVHHARCQVKHVSANCHVEAPEAPGWMARAGSTHRPDLTHTCDSEQGASGAPLFDLSGRLVALHHAGFARDAQCRATDRVNKAVRMSEVVASLPPALRQELKIGN